MKISTPEITALLRAKYPQPRWAYFEEVRNATGYDRTQRYCDGLALGLWPSNGLELIGFEVKGSRRGWLRELKDPAKSNEFFRFCDRWYLVTHEGVVKRDELPSQWGLMEVAEKGRNRLVVCVEAPKQAAPVPLDRGFVASIARNMHAGVENIIANRIGVRDLAEVATRKENADVVGNMVADQLKKTQTFLSELGEALGLDPYNMGLHAKDNTVAKVKAAMAVLRAQRELTSRIDACEKHSLRLVSEGVENMRSAHQAWREVVQPDGSDR